ncbi:hypothetical protein H8E88_31045 [candidate division KSB1 bacterium]|nr:hypothetical protein [candidate division KSB1 bacterium]MBL7095621.1 hypothetical protein [candidate division KSB1 bacterium]
MRVKFTTREIALLALLSTVWAAIEVNFGILLQTLQVPFKGAFLTFLALIVLFIGRDLVPKRGAVLLMGLTTAFIKFIFLGGMAISPVIGIFMEVILVEMCLYQNQPRNYSFCLAGAAGLAWTFVHPFFTQGLLAGWGILKVYKILIEKGAALFGFDQQFFGIFLLLFVIHILLGAIAGAIGFKFSQLIIRRYYSLPVCERSYDY